MNFSFYYASRASALISYCAADMAKIWVQVCFQRWILESEELNMLYLMLDDRVWNTHYHKHCVAVLMRSFFSQIFTMNTP